MVTNEIVRDGFAKCKEPIDYVQRYKYFKVKACVKEAEDIKEALCYIEQLTPLGALYIALLKEKDIASNYIADFVCRNRKELINKIQIDNSDNVLYMQVLYLCLMYLNAEDRELLCCDVFASNVYRSEESEQTEVEDKKRVTERYVKVFLSAVNDFHKDIIWGTKYCEIATGIYQARNEDIDFLHGIEVGLRKVPLGYVIGDVEAREYFNLLCEHKDYDAAKFFLDNFDGSQGFLGIDMLQFAEYLFGFPDPGLLVVAKRCMILIRGQEYKYNDWYEDFKKYNCDVECDKWMRLTLYYHSLQELVKKEEWDVFEKMIHRAKNYTMFDMDKIKYMKQMVHNFVYIVNRIILSKVDMLVPFLKEINEININSYSRTKYLSVWNQQDSIKGYDYETIQKILFEFYSLEDVVFVYMNSHLKSVINIEDFVERCSADKEGKIYELFKEYPLWGSVSLGSKLSSVRDKIYISPVGVASKVSFYEYVQVCETYGHLSNEAKSFNRRLIRSEQKWYSHNKEAAELMRNGDICTFYIKSYQKNQGIMAVDLALNHEVMVQRVEERKAKYPAKVLNWLSQIQTTKTYVKWNQDEPIYGASHLDINSRIDIAIEILNTICELQGHISELESFIGSITNAPLEEINEFRYISTQRRFVFSFPQGRFDEIRRYIIDKADTVLKNTGIPANLRKDIYLNTCIRKFYDLLEVCKQVGEEIYVDTAEEPFVIALKFEEKKNNNFYFSTKGRSNTLFCRRIFVYKGECEKELEPGDICLVTLRNYDTKEGYFVLDKVNLSNAETEQWKKYLRKVRDIKKVTDDAELLGIKHALRRYTVRVASKNHISQFVHEMNIIFRTNKFSIEKTLKVLDVISETNPFLDTGKDFSCFKDIFKETYSESYDLFLEDYRERYKSEMGFCDLYFTSYLKVFVDFDAFVDDIAEGGIPCENILAYCRYKKYI